MLANRHMSQKIMLQMAVVALLVIALAFHFSDTLQQIYLSHQQTSAGLVLNGLICLLFLIGMLRILTLLVHYAREEHSLVTFRRNMDQQRANLLEEVDTHSMIARRYEAMESMQLQHAPIQHQVFAATLLANENNRTAPIRFVHNILILCGVLGTIVSLSIALVGASSLLEQAVSSSGMGMVIHGMSTALSTTMSAIVCYLILAYFHAALQGVQSRLLADLEYFTSTRLLPRLQSSATAVESRAVELVSQAQLLVQSLHDYFEALNPDAITQRIEAAAKASEQQSQRQHAELSAQLQQLASLLRDGFRLPGA